VLSYVRHSKSNGSLSIFMGATVDTESTIILRASSQLQNIIFFFSIVTTTSWFAQMSWSRCSSLHSDSCVAIEHGLSFMLLLLLLKVPPASALLYSQPLFLIFINIQQASMSVGAIFLHRGIQLYPFALYMLHQMPLCTCFIRCHFVRRPLCCHLLQSNRNVDGKVQPLLPYHHHLPLMPWTNIIK